MSIFSIEGNIGSGKSTLTKFLQEHFKNREIAILQEPVEEWKNTKDSNNKSILEHFYKDINKYAFSFQMNSFISRTEKIQQSKKYPVIIMERSVYSDSECFAKTCYENKQMTEIEYLIYKKWFNWLVNSFEINHKGHIYLRTDPDECFNRIHKRNRSEEAKIPKEYIHQLHKKHDEWLLNNKNILVLDGNKNFETDIKIRNELISKIEAFIK